MSINFFLDNSIPRIHFPKFEGSALPETNAKQLFSLFELTPPSTITGFPGKSLQNSPFEFKSRVEGRRIWPSDSHINLEDSPNQTAPRKAFFTARKSVARIATLPKFISVLKLPRSSSCFLSTNRSEIYDKNASTEESVETNFCSPVKQQSPPRYQQRYLGGSQFNPVRRSQDLIEGKLNSGKDICKSVDKNPSSSFDYE